MTTLYDADFYSWAKRQAELLRRRSGNEIDWDQIAGEMDNLAGSEERELVARLRVLLSHLLKWAFQPERRTRSWRLTIANQRDELTILMRRNPGLKAKEAEAFSDAYRLARRDASLETDLDVDVFPAEPPFTIDQAKDEAYLPE
ncbi:MAG: DUF29 domain-containing protein [Hyphomonadaceae bacterium]|nr:DUF29 domain-containing protein [Hyphomonadaceae bacterium]